MNYNMTGIKYEEVEYMNGDKTILIARKDISLFEKNNNMRFINESTEGHCDCFGCTETIYFYDSNREEHSLCITDGTSKNLNVRCEYGMKLIKEMKENGTYIGTDSLKDIFLTIEELEEFFEDTQEFFGFTLSDTEKKQFRDEYINGYK